jgi:phosphoenolpyruvate carboxykinase (ATP)
VFGLSGSGKSTLTHAKHGNKYDVTVLHDDAFIISTEDGSSIALEPSYFDKIADYPLSSPDNKYLLSVQNCGVTMDEDGQKVIVTEDLRNGNGRAIKSRLWSPNRVNKFEEPVNAIFWLMKDPTLPPVLKLKGSELGSVMGATLATKRTSAERLAPGVDPNALVVEPYANPFRTYPLVNDYISFRNLFRDKEVDCYILNTGHFIDKKIEKETTLGILEAIIENKADFKQWGPFKEIEIMEIEGFIPDIEDIEYREELKRRMYDRVNFIESREVERGGLDRLPEEAKRAILDIINEI